MHCPGVCRCSGTLTTLATKASGIRRGRLIAGRDACARVMATADFKRTQRAALERVEVEAARLAPEWAGAVCGSHLQPVPDHSPAEATVAQLPSCHCDYPFASLYTCHKIACMTVIRLPT
jgi:hypothetical protein